jgi:hypothetical protein
MDDNMANWQWLAAAVVERAVNDARHYALTSHCRRRSRRLAADAVDWLAAGGCGLLDVFNLDAAAVTQTLQAGQGEHEPARNRAR